MTTTSHPTTAFSAYRSEVARIPHLTWALEQDLVRRCKQGDRDAARRLAEGCLPCVISIAAGYQRWGIPLEDLVQEGNIGLLKAIDHFDPRHGVRLVTYAAYRIRSQIRAFVVRHHRIVRMGSTKRETRAIWLYRRTREQRPEELAARSGLPTERVAELLPLLLAGDISLSLPRSDDGSSPVERLADGTASPEDQLCHLETHGQLQAAVADVLSELPPREQDIVRRRLLAEDPITLEALGAAWGVTKERIRQIEEQVKAQVRERFMAHRSTGAQARIAGRMQAAPARRSL